MSIQNGYKVRGYMLRHWEGQAAVAACPFCCLKEVAIAVINTRRCYPEDQFLDVSGGVTDALEGGLILR